MTRRLPILMLALVALAGCGSDDEKPAGARSATTGGQAGENTAPATRGVATATGERPTAPRSGATKPAPRTPSTVPTTPKPKDTPSLRAGALRDCRDQAGSATGLSAAARQRAKGLCDAAAGRSAAEIRRAARDACVVLAEDTTKKGTSDRAAKLENCGLIL